MNITIKNTINALTELFSAQNTQKTIFNVLNGKKGAALVEMAIILPFLFLIVFGIFEFGRAMYITNTLNNAARYGARLAVVSTSPLNIASLTTEIKNHTPLSAADLDIIDISIPNGSPSSGTAVTVTVLLPFTPIIPIMEDFFPSGFKLKGEATMRYES